MSEISIQDLESCNELITHLTTLTLILKDTVKIKKILRLKLKKLEQKNINEIKFLKEGIFIMTLRNKHLGRSNYDTNEEEIDLKKQAKKRIYKIEELKEDVEWESKAAKLLQDLNYEKNDEIAVTAKVEQKLIKSGILKRCLHLVLKEQLKNT